MILLGSTGSIGVNTLHIARIFKKEISALVAGENITLLNAQIEEFRPKMVAIKHEKNIKDVVSHGAKVLVGNEGISEILESLKDNLVVNAIVGFAGLWPSIESKRLNKKLALANKESLVSAGWLFDDYDIMPIDSEHFSLWSLLKNIDKDTLSSLYITASGGAFRDVSIDKIATSSIQDALNHPNWKMGRKITIDSATMANKLFEVLEARWLFKISNVKIDALIERSSSIHALLGLKDGSYHMHLASPDMKLPISYALDDTMAKKDMVSKNINLLDSNIAFQKIDILRYPLWELKDALLENAALGVVLNASNEVCVERFLNGEIPFGDISKNVINMCKKYDDIKMANLKSYEDIKEVDLMIRDSSRR